MSSDNTKPAIILGAGGHAKVIAEALLHSQTEILGFVTPDKNIGEKYFGHMVLGDDEIILNYRPDEIILANGIGSLPNSDMRWRVATQMREHGYAFSTIIHPKSIVANDVCLSEGVQLMAGSVVQTGAKIGEDCIINTGVLIDHDCVIEAGCHLAPGVVCSGGVRVGRRVHVGTGTSVINNISIGDNVIIAAGSVVYEDIPRDVRFMQSRSKK